MAWTTTDLANIEAAIASGTLSVQFGDRRVQYQSIGELIKARDLIKAEVDLAVSSSTRCTFASFSKD